MKKIEYEVVEGTEVYPANEFGTTTFYRKVGRVVETITELVDGKTFTQTVFYPLEGAALDEYIKRGKTEKSIPEILAKYKIRPEEKTIEETQKKESISITTDYHRLSVKEERVWPPLQFDTHMLMDWEPNKS